MIHLNGRRISSQENVIKTANARGTILITQNQGKGFRGELG